MYSKEKTMREKGGKVTPFKKVEEATGSGSNLILIFKATKDVSTAVNTHLKPDPSAHIIIKNGSKISVTVNSGNPRPLATAKARPQKQLIAAGTEIEKTIDLLSEEISVPLKSRDKN